MQHVRDNNTQHDTTRHEQAQGRTGRSTHLLAGGGTGAQGTPHNRAQKHNAGGSMEDVATVAATVTVRVTAPRPPGQTEPASTYVWVGTLPRFWMVPLGSG